AAPAPPPPSGPRMTLPSVDWERWIGVRGAAVLGGIVLALAGLYFFQYSIEHGLIPPWLRVVLGTLVGLGCIAGAELRARERYPTIANPLVGGGTVVLYAAFWAARARYGLVGTEMAFVLMVAVTAAGTALAYKHNSLVIALIGLIGGFATPMLISSGSDRPIALFAYILLLDGCLLFMAYRRRWPILAVLSLVGTVFYQAGWIANRMESHQVLLAMAVLGIFAVAYALVLRDTPRDGRRAWLITQGGAALFPFVFALYLAGRSDLGDHFAPLGVLLALLSASACWLARVQGRAWLGLGAASGTTAVFAVWLLGHGLEGLLAWEAMGLCVLLAGVFHVFVELDRETQGSRGPGPAAVVSVLGLLTAAIGAALANGDDAPLWPWLTGWLALAALAIRQAGFPGREPLHAATAALLALGWWPLRWAYSGDAAAPSYELYCAVVVFVAVAGQVVALRRSPGRARVWAEHGAALFAAVMLLSQPIFPRPESQTLLSLGTGSLLGFLVLLSAARSGRGGWVFAAVALTALVQLGWTVDDDGRNDRVVALGLALQLCTAVLFTVWPLVAFAGLRGARWAWYGAALALPAWFFSLRELYVETVDDDSIGLLAVGLGAVALAAAVQVSRLRAADDPRRTSNLAWFLAVALGFVTAAIPLQLDKEWITIGWALEGLAVTLLWRRLDHPGLKYFALALFAGVTIRLVANDAVLGYYERPSWRIVNWLFYTYLVPAAAMLGAARVLARDEVDRARSGEGWLYGRGHALGAIGTGLAALAVFFVWMNLAIADWFATGESLRVSYERMPARDLTTSIAWAVYALGLLAAGVRGGSRGLRWLSLGLMLVTIVKVFLYDLGELEDLYRVASLLGLAISLIVVSFAYQRFVVVRDTAPENP
ncbi:MAG: DUF2339 domain-containing protein, partial [Proteobacteria bacterium]|nr:DUF2339 domain-containing protein [Pseudomonadota bacterium]